MSKSPRNLEFDELEEFGYRKGCKIGEGAFSIVLKGDLTDNTGRLLPLACKIIDKSKESSDFVKKFFPRELEIIKKIDHPNIIQTHSIIQRGPRVYIFMRLAEKGDLFSHILKNGPVKELQAKTWFAQMIMAINYLHSLNIAHRDIKCENVLLSKNNNIKLADFDFACNCSYNKRGRIELSETYCGSPAYSAPEVLNNQPYDPKIADLWSIGIILYTLLNACFPFFDPNERRNLFNRCNKLYTFRRDLKDRITKEAKATVAGLLEPDPDERWTIEEIYNCRWLQGDKDEEE